MHLYVLQNLELGLEMTIMGDLQEITKHIDPKLIGGVGLKDDSCNIVL